MHDELVTWRALEEVDWDLCTIGLSEHVDQKHRSGPAALASDPRPRSFSGTLMFFHPVLHEGLFHDNIFCMLEVH